MRKRNIPLSQKLSSRVSVNTEIVQTNTSSVKEVYQVYNHTAFMITVAIEPGKYEKL